MSQPAGPFAREHPRAWIGRAPEELIEGWIDDMVRRLLEECNRQMIKLENASRKAPDDQDEPRLRERNAGALGKLRRELKEILRMEDDRAVKRAVQNTRQESDAIAALERRLDQLLEREATARLPVESGSGGRDKTS